MTVPPRRWSGTELSEELEAALSSADADSSEQAIARMRARLSDTLGPSFAEVPPPKASTGPAQPAARAVRLLTPGKWFGMGALLAIGFGALWIRGPGAPDERAGRAESKPSAVGAREGTGAVHGVHGVTETQPVVQPAAPAPTPEAPAPQAAPRKHAEPKPQLKAAAQAKPPVAELGLAEELRQLEQIRKRLRVSPERALAEADTHARRFPHGTLGPERELLRVDALLRLGRSAEAHKLAERMLAAPEGHPYRAQIEKLLSRP